MKGSGEEGVNDGEVKAKDVCVTGRDRAPTTQTRSHCKASLLTIRWHRIGANNLSTE